VSLNGATGTTRTVVALAVPPRDSGSSMAAMRSGPVMSWQQLEEPSVRGTLQFSRMAWLSMGRVRAGAHRVVHDPRRASSPASSDLHIVLQVSGTNTVEQSGRVLTLGPGHWAVLAGDLAYAMTSRERTERLVLVISRDNLQVDIKPTQVSGRVCSGASGTGRLFYSTALCLADELPYIGVENAENLAGQLVTLLHIALRGETSVGVPQPNEVRREQVHRYVAGHLRDPQLSVERIAADLGWSRRTLARLLETQGETLMEHVYRKRLEGSRRDLLNPILEDYALSDIARSWGFRNYTHFSDRFRSHFGLSPTAVRRRALLVHAKLDGASDEREATGD
jgi:AraC-like DNA-binding protein